MTTDPFSHIADSLIAPASRAFAITPADQGTFSVPPKALYIGSGGDVALRPINSVEDVVLRNVVGGTVLAIRVAAVRSTGTTASNIVGLA